MPWDNCLTRDLPPPVEELNELLNEPAPLGSASNPTWTPTGGNIARVNGNVVWVNNDWTTDYWTTWNMTATTTTLQTELIWNTWANTTVSTGTGNLIQYRQVPAAVGDAVRRNTSENEWAAIEQRVEEQRAERDELFAAARAAGSRLLAMILDAEQLASFARNAYFDLVGSSGQLWRVHHGTAGNVRAMGVDGAEIMRICAHPALWDNEGQGHLPTEDVVAAQALHLIHDDVEFLRRANVHRGDRRSLELALALVMAA